MFIHPEIASQLAREHRRDMLAEVSQRQLRRQRGHQPTRNPNVAGRIIRRVATAIAGAGIAALPALGAACRRRSRCEWTPAGVGGGPFARHAARRPIRAHTSRCLQRGCLPILQRADPIHRMPSRSRSHHPQRAELDATSNRQGIGAPGGERGLGAGVLVFGRSWQDRPSDSRDVAVIGTATASQHCDMRAC